MLQGLTQQEVKISFTPILAPMPRGILATVTARTSLSEPALRELIWMLIKMRGSYLSSKGQLPETSSLIGSNGAQIQIAVDEHTSRLVVSWPSTI